MAWLLGAANKNADATGLLPKVNQGASGLVMTFDCLSVANRGTMVLTLQHSGDLGSNDPWADLLVPGTAPFIGNVSGVDFVATANGDLIPVVATIPSSGNAMAGKLFGRLTAGDTPPELLLGRLRLEVVSTWPASVIGVNTPGAAAISGGFDGGTTVKVNIAGQTQDHLFSSGMENMDWSAFQMELWISHDGNSFQRQNVLLGNCWDSATGLNHLFLSPYPLFSETDNRWYMIFMEFVVTGGWNGQSGIMWCAPCSVTGTGGINGPWDFANSYVIVPKQYAPINGVVPAATSVSMPF